MKAIMVMYDSLNRHLLSNYGCDWTITPNFKRLAERTVTFDNSYIGSFPCMPARRELHTGRYNFLHRSWGPIEPYDDSMPELLHDQGIYTHLVSDHQHYWEDGGATYHHRYSSWEIVRGQEGDRWKGVVDPEDKNGMGMKVQDAINRSYIDCDEKMPQTQTFNLGLEFMETNKNADNWFLQLETFDPHEPFFTQEEYKKLYPHEYDGPQYDWPPYGPVTEPRNVVEHCRYEYAALLTMCDRKLGQVLDFMDANDMWKDTMLIVNTDHGFMLGEHNMWAKGNHPMYNEVVNTPLFVWDPRTGVKDVRRNALVQTIDLAPTILEFFGVEIPKDMQGKALRPVIEKDGQIHDGALFGTHGGLVHVTDGRYVYMRDFNRENGNKPLFEYTQMPTHMRNMFSIDEMKTAEMAPPFSYTKGSPLMKINGGMQPFPKISRPGGTGKITAAMMRHHMPAPGGNESRTVLFDVVNDPGQTSPIQDRDIEERMILLLVKLMKESDAPAEQYVRLGLEAYQ